MKALNFKKPFYRKKHIAIGDMNLNWLTRQLTGYLQNSGQLALNLVSVYYAHLT